MFSLAHDRQLAATFLQLHTRLRPRWFAILWPRSTLRATSSRCHLHEVSQPTARDLLVQHASQSAGLSVLDLRRYRWSRDTVCATTPGGGLVGSPVQLRTVQLAVLDFLPACFYGSLVSFYCVGVCAESPVYRVVECPAECLTGTLNVTLGIYSGRRGGQVVKTNMDTGRCHFQI